MAAHRTGGGDGFSVSVSGEGSRRGDPGDPDEPSGELEGGAASSQGCHHLAGRSRADPGGRRLGRLPDRLVSGRVPLASRDPESGRSPLEPVVVRAIWARSLRASRRTLCCPTRPESWYPGGMSEARCPDAGRQRRALSSAERASSPRASGPDPESRDRTGGARKPSRGDESDRRGHPRGRPG
jgi:hypothetical protein